MSNVEKFEYQGPEQVYRPNIDNLYYRRRAPNVAEIPSGGYHDLDYLNEMLNNIAHKSGAVFTTASKILASYSLKIEPDNEELMSAHELVYPDDDTPGYITFDEYKYLLTAGNSNAVQLLRNHYETRVRGPKGIASLDYLLIARFIHGEVGRIRNFLTTYIGELDETAEFRTVELFQDWAEDTSLLLQELQTRVKTQVTTGLSQSELDSLDPGLFGRYQVLFQAKLNEVNKIVKDNFALIEKNWDQPAADFYNRVLGPALLFQVKVANALTDPIHTADKSIPNLVKEAANVVTGMSANYTVALADQMRRNENFFSYVASLFKNIDQRDVNKNAILQLESKGKAISSPFVSSSTVNQADTVLNAPNPLDRIYSSQMISTAVRPSHYDLFDRLALDAHPQYFPTIGGTIVGDVELAEGVKIDGIVPSTHKHNGLDGSSKISGADIVFGSVAEDVINTDSTTSVPENLSVFSQTSVFDASGTPRVAAEVVFSVDNTANIVGYEFEVIKLS